jgi:hypothetical protein
MTSRSRAASATVRAIGPAASWASETGMIPERLRDHIDDAINRLFADFDIEILHSVHGGVAAAPPKPHLGHRPQRTRPSSGNGRTRADPDGELYSLPSMGWRSETARPFQP